MWEIFRSDVFWAGAGTAFGAVTLEFVRRWFGRQESLLKEALILRTELRREATRARKEAADWMARYYAETNKMASLIADLNMKQDEIRELQQRNSELSLLIAARNLEVPHHEQERLSSSSEDS